jgi:hypothetical protein
MKKDIKPIPEFKNEDEEREFWATHSSVDYFDLSTAYRPIEPFHNLKPSEDLLEFKMPLDDMKSLDTLANEQHVTRDVLARNVLHEWINRQQGRAHA